MRARNLLLLSLLWSVAWAGDVTLSGAGGAPLHALSSGKGPQGVLIVHGADGHAAALADLTERLGERGFHVLAVDLRGHGESPGPVDDTALPEDLDAAVRWMRARGVTDIAVLGVAEGGNLALDLAARDAGVGRVVLISPRLAGFGVKVSAALAGYGERPMLLVTGSEDTTGVRAAGALGGRLAGPHLVEVVDGARAGVDLFRQAPHLEGLVVSWLRGDAAAKQGADRLQSSDVGEIETTGTRYGE